VFRNSSSRLELDFKDFEMSMTMNDFRIKSPLSLGLAIFGMALALLLALAPATPAQAQTMSLGFVNQDRILRDSIIAKNAEKKLEQEFSKRSKELQDIEARMKTLRDRMEREAPTTSESERMRRQRELADIDKDYQRRARETQEDFNQRRNEEYAGIIERARKAVQQVAEQDKIDLIVTDAVYFSPRIDITDKVLRVLANAR
jgi:outer membrane protein